MRIAQISPLYEAVPPSLYGGTERVIATLTDALVDLGHQVTLFATADSRTKAELVAVRRRPLRLDANPLKSETAAHLALLNEVRQQAGRFDILHFHTDMIHFPFFNDIADKTLTTLHGRLDLADLPKVYLDWPDFKLVSVSDAQRRPLPFANWAATVYHGLASTCAQPVEAQTPGYLAFLGRFSPEKGPDRAIEIARRCGKRLKIAAKIDAADRQYFEARIAPLLAASPFVDYVGEISDRQKPEFLGKAEALLFPIDWPEPFGLVMIEAFSCGTPVVAYGCGSVPEIVENGLTGFIVANEAEAAAAASRAADLDRASIRNRYKQRFAADTMAKNYVAVYERMLASSDRTATRVRVDDRIIPPRISL